MGGRVVVYTHSPSALAGLTQGRGSLGALLRRRRADDRHIPTHSIISASRHRGTAWTALASVVHARLLSCLVSLSGMLTQSQGWAGGSLSAPHERERTRRLSRRSSFA